MWPFDTWFQRAPEPSPPPLPVPLQPAATEIQAAGITAPDVLMGRDVDPRYSTECTLDVRGNIADLVLRVNQVLRVYGGPVPHVNSGWRPTAVNLMCGGAPNSQHRYGRAVDLADPDGALQRWAMDNLKALALVGLWMESPKATPGWVHWQSAPPKSGARVFLP